MGVLVLSSIPCILRRLAGNTISNMQNSGISVAESFDSEFYNNTVNNARYGIRFSTGSKRHNVYENTFKDIHKGKEKILWKILWIVWIFCCRRYVFELCKERGYRQVRKHFVKGIIP